MITANQALDAHYYLVEAAKSAIVAHYVSGFTQGGLEVHLNSLENSFKLAAQALGYSVESIPNELALEVPEYKKAI